MDATRALIEALSRRGQRKRLERVGTRLSDALDEVPSAQRDAIARAVCLAGPRLQVDDEDVLPDVLYAALRQSGLDGAWLRDHLPELQPRLALRHVLHGTAASDRRSSGQVCAFSPDGRRLLVSVAGGAVHERDANTGEVLRVFGRFGVRAAVYRPDGRRVLTASPDGLQEWDASTGVLLTTFDGFYTSCDYSPCGARVLACGEDVCIRPSDATQPVWRYTDGLNTSYHHCAYSADGKRVLVSACTHWGCNPTDILELSTETGLVLRSASVGRGGLKHWINGLAYAADGEGFFVAADHRLMRWEQDPAEDPDEGERRWSRYSVNLQPVADTGYDASFAVTPRGTTLLTAIANAVEVYDARSFVVRDRLRCGQGDEVARLAYSRDGALLACLTSAGAVHVRNGASGTLLRSLAAPRAHGAAVASCALTPDARYALAHYEDGTVVGWNVELGAPMELPFERAPVLGYRSDLARVLIGSVKRLEEWDLVDRRLVHVYEAPKRPITTCGYSPDGSRVVAGCGRGVLVEWSVESHELLGWFYSPHPRRGDEPDLSLGRAETHAFSAAGDRLRARFEVGEVEWEVSTRRVLANSFAGPLPEPAVDLDGAEQLSLTASSDGAITLRARESTEPMLRFRGDVPFRCLALAGSTLIAGDALGKLWVFELRLDPTGVT